MFQESEPPTWLFRGGTRHYLVFTLQVPLVGDTHVGCQADAPRATCGLGA
jgi:hypothetical protein